MFKHRLWTPWWVVVASSLLPAQATQPQLKRLVGISSEDGIIAVSGNTVSTFSTANISLQGVRSSQWRLAEKRGDAVSVAIEGAGIHELLTHLPISTAHGFAFCDALNQVDIDMVDHNLRSVLPAGARVKSLVRIGDDLSLVVYSVSPKAVRYDVRVGVLQSKPSGGYTLVGDDLATDSGNFCGLQQGDRGVFFVFADEPSGSSDFSAVYAYTVEVKSREQR